MATILTKSQVSSFIQPNQLKDVVGRAPYPYVSDAVPENYSFVLAFTSTCDHCFYETVAMLREWVVVNDIPVAICDGGGTPKIGLLFAPSDNMPGKVPGETATSRPRPSDKVPTATSSTPSGGGRRSGSASAAQRGATPSAGVGPFAQYPYPYYDD